MDPADSPRPAPEPVLHDRQPRAGASFPVSPFAPLAHALMLAGATAAVFLAGKPQEGAMGVFLVFAGAAMIGCPPRVPVGWRLWLAAAAVVGCGALALLPEHVLLQPAWRRTLDTTPALVMPGTINYLARADAVLAGRAGPVAAGRAVPARATDPLALAARPDAGCRAGRRRLRRDGHLCQAHGLGLSVRVRGLVRIFPQPQPHGDAAVRRRSAGAGGVGRGAARGPLVCRAAGGRGHRGVRGGSGVLFAVARRGRVPAGGSGLLDRRAGPPTPRHADDGVPCRRAGGGRDALFAGGR